MHRQLLIKRSIDVVASVVLLLFLLLPVLLLYTLAWLMAKDRSETLLYPDLRVGWRGKSIVLYKLRTVNPRTGRVSLVRRIMRRSGFDELPQLWNIFKGEMSFVDPRPLRANDELVRYGGVPEWRRAVRPGLICTYGLTIHRVQKGTDLYQEPVPDAVAVDMDWHYVQEWSLTSDVRVLWYAITTFFYIARTCFKR